MKIVTRLPGMRDLSPAAWLRQRELQDKLLSELESYGYRLLDTPVLEPTELFLRKSGGELASRLFSFTDPGSNAISLRPEFTSSIMRHYLERAEDIALPARWRYAGPVFRYAEEASGRGQFTQVGAELLGSGSVLADAEILGLAAQFPARLGATGYHIELGDLDSLHAILDTVDLSERARDFIIASVPRLRQGAVAIPAALKRALQLRVVGESPEENPLSAALAGLEPNQARQALRGMTQWAAASQLGQRDPEDIVEGLLRKLKGSDSPQMVERGLELAAQLAAIHGEPQAALAEARRVTQVAGADPSPLERLASLLRLLENDANLRGNLVLDFGLARGLAYYSGIVFEVKGPSGRYLGGGGRYDGLARALGSERPVPALGFAYTLENLVALLPPLAEENDSRKPSRLVTLAGAESYTTAQEFAEQWREQGYVVEVDVAGMALPQALERSSQMGIAEVVEMGQTGPIAFHKVG